MRRALFPTIAVFLVGGSAAFAECKCAIAMVSDGECAQCKVKFANGEKSKTTSGG